MKSLVSLLFLILFLSCNSGNDEISDREEITSILLKQQEAWSNYNLEGFMEGYWRSDSLKFYSGGNLNKGWQNTLDNYKLRYPTKAQSGKLEFKIADIAQINESAYWVMGEYHLTREIGDAKGTFLIIFKRINGKWKIVADSSC
ncbi:YybH family protein [Maribacter aestuarii]|uniref:YybH family protein n=1 Tax=Maribacter aestuarii TaxID=1130723 RepID=UPI00248C2529|nr:nuclear transport factor 2 family protein [Maribacter aestuarii]